MSLKNILINDHLKMNLICKDFYFKKKNTNDNDLKNMLKTIQAVINKKLKNIEKLDLIKEIETEFKNGEVKPRKSTNSRGSSNSNGSNPKKVKQTVSEVKIVPMVALRAKLQII
jgi:hypothetical protein